MSEPSRTSEEGDPLVDKYLVDSNLVGEVRRVIMMRVNLIKDQIENVVWQVEEGSLRLSEVRSYRQLTEGSEHLSAEYRIALHTFTERLTTLSLWFVEIRSCWSSLMK